jgi:succinoglycan biosynthesis protein ExoA
MSVVMPARDDAAHLPAAVEAMLAQEFDRPFEVVIAVGPSRDGTEEVAERLARQHPQVRVVANPDGGTAAGLNAAIQASSGDVVARVDSHSELTPGYLARAFDLLQETGADNVGGIQQAVGTTPSSVRSPSR